MKKTRYNNGEFGTCCSEIKIEHLVATVGNGIIDLYKKMNLKCDAVIANQTDEVNLAVKKVKGNEVKILSTNTTGVGANRNLGIMLSSADLCILSDDDMEYKSDYLEIIKSAFTKLKKADIIIFNIKTTGNSTIKRRINHRIKRINYLNFMNYGAARIVFKRNSVIKNNIWFSELFGGGSIYSSGEDTLFLADALRKRLKIYAFPAEIATVNQQKSTWFCGYNEKYFYDKGALIGQVFPGLKYLFIFLYYPCRFKSNIHYTAKVRCLYWGMRNYKNGITYEMWKNMI